MSFQGQTRHDGIELCWLRVELCLNQSFLWHALKAQQHLQHFFCFQKLCYKKVTLCRTNEQIQSKCWLSGRLKNYVFIQRSLFGCKLLLWIELGEKDLIIQCRGYKLQINLFCASCCLFSGFNLVYVNC